MNKNIYEKSIRIYKTFSRRHTYSRGVRDGDDRRRTWIKAPIVSGLFINI